MQHHQGNHPIIIDFVIRRFHERKRGVSSDS